MSSKRPVIQLSTREQKEIGRWLTSHGTPQQVALRSRIVLAAATGRSDGAVAQELEINRKTVMLWRGRFAQEGIDSLWDVAPGRGRKPTFGPEKIEAIVNATLQAKPKEMTQWSCRLMAKNQNVSKSTVSNIWRHHDLKPHRVKSFKLSRDVRFLEKLTDVVGLYLNPPQQALVLCVDEKSQIHAGSNAAGPAAQKRPLRHYDSRLQTQRHDHALCRVGSPPRQGRWSMLQTAPAPGILKVSATAGPRVYRPDPPAPRDGQLRHTQASQGASLAQRTSSFSPALCADKFQLVESGGTVVWRTHFQTSPPWILQQRERPAKGYRRVSGGWNEMQNPLSGRPQWNRFSRSWLIADKPWSSQGPGLCSASKRKPKNPLSS